MILVFIMVLGCSSRYATPDELIAFVSDPSNGLHPSFEHDGGKVEVSYKPVDLILLQESEGRNVSQLAIDSLRKSYSAYYYFVVSFSNNGREALHSRSPNEYGELISTLSFRMHEFVNMTTSEGDKIPVADFVLNRTYGMAGSTDLMVVFSRKKEKDPSWIQVNINEFGLGIGNLRFRFESDDLDDVPEIAFSII